MSPCRLLLLPLLLLPIASASHFWGGTVSFDPKGRNPDGSLRVDIRYKESFDSCGSSLSYGCSGSCGSQTSVERGVIYNTNGRYPSNYNWCLKEIVTTRSLWSNKPFRLTAASCCWVSLRSGPSGWNLPVLLDLGVRSDTNEPNHSPHATIISFVRVPQNCHREYNFVGCDPDGDHVKCRTSRSLPAGFSLDQDSCTLHYYPPYAFTGAHGFELLVEDFPKDFISLNYSDGTTSYKSPPLHLLPTPAATTPWPHNISPLSRLPLQFVVLVDPTVPSCTEGVYLPKFQHPTPHNGEKLYAAINQELEIRINATASNAMMNDIIISGPLNVTKDTTTSGEYVIRWTPRSEDHGGHFPICFIAESALVNGVTYQSEMRCVVVKVGHQQATTGHVTCSENFMAIEVETMLADNVRIHEDHLRLNDPSCTLYSNGSHVLANMSLNTCGTTVEEDENSLIFRNEIVSFDDPNDVITRIHHVELKFFCKYPKKSTMSLEFDAHRNPYVFTQKGFGTFTYQFEFFQSNRFQNQKDPNSYPVEYDLGDMMYMQIEAISPLSNTELFVESCMASPSDDPHAHISYPIIGNGCKKDETVQFFSNHQNKVQFGMKAFKFIGWHDQVFITCSVILCEAGNPNTRCSQGCTNATAAPALHHHHRREAPIQTTSHFISQGPVRLSRGADIRDAPSTVAQNGLNMNVVFIAGCLLIVVAMVCGALIYLKRPKTAYQPLPSTDY